MRKQRFGKASEQSGQLQFDLFNEVEEVIENHQIEATVEEPQAKERKRKVKSNFNH